jgi:hypothetical protein
MVLWVGAEVSRVEITVSLFGIELQDATAVPPAELHGVEARQTAVPTT